MFYVSWKTHTAQTEKGFELPYRCDACELETTARVTARGVGTSTTYYGLGEGEAGTSAARNAAANAHYQARQVLRGTPCPRCQRFPAAVRAAVRAAVTAQNRLNKARITLGPVGAVVGMLVGLALVLALGGRPVLLFAAVGLAALAWGVAILLTARRVPVPELGATRGTSFWLSPPDRDPPAWVEASDADAQWPDLPVNGPGPHLRLFGGAAAICGVVLTLIGGITWQRTTATLHVVNVYAEDAIVRIDGETRRGIAAHVDANHDVASNNYWVPFGSHHIEVVNHAGVALGTADVDLKSDTLYAPGAWRVGVCFVREVAWYSRSNPRPSEECTLEMPQDLLRIRRHYSAYFTSPPSQIEVRHASATESRAALRAVDCAHLDELVPPLPRCAR